MRKHVKVQDCPVAEKGQDCFADTRYFTVDIPDWSGCPGKSWRQYWEDYEPSDPPELKPFNEKQSQAIKEAYQKRKEFESKLPLGRLMVVRHNRGCTATFLAKAYKIPLNVVEKFLDEQQRLGTKVNLHLDENCLNRVVAFVEPMCKNRQLYYDRRRRIARLLTRRWHRELKGG